MDTSTTDHNRKLRLGPHEKTGYLWWRKTKRMSKRAYQAKHGSKYKHSVRRTGRATRYARSTVIDTQMRDSAQIIDPNSQHKYHEDTFAKSLFWYMFISGITTMDRTYDDIIHYDYQCATIDNLLNGYLLFLSKIKQPKSFSAYIFGDPKYSPFMDLPIFFHIMTIYFAEVIRETFPRWDVKDKQVDNMSLVPIEDGVSVINELRPQHVIMPSVEINIIKSIIGVNDKLRTLKSIMYETAKKIDVSDIDTIINQVDEIVSSPCNLPIMHNCMQLMYKHYKSYMKPKYREYTMGLHRMNDGRYSSSRNSCLTYPNDRKHIGDNQHMTTDLLDVVLFRISAILK